MLKRVLLYVSLEKENVVDKFATTLEFASWLSIIALVVLVRGSLSADSRFLASVLNLNISFGSLKKRICKSSAELALLSELFFDLMILQYPIWLYHPVQGWWNYKEMRLQCNPPSFDDCWLWCFLGYALSTQQSASAVSRSLNFTQLSRRFPLGVEDHRLRPASVPSSSGSWTHLSHFSQRFVTIAIHFLFFFLILGWISDAASSWHLKQEADSSTSLWNLQVFPDVPYTNIYIQSWKEIRDASAPCSMRFYEMR